MSDDESVDDVEVEEDEFDDSNILVLEDDFPEWKAGQDPVSNEQWDDWADQFEYEDMADLKGQGRALEVNWAKREVHLVDPSTQQ